MSNLVQRPNFKEKYDNYIGGKFVAPASGEYFDVISIKAVSKHNWMSGETALGFIFSPTLWGDHEKCWEYALKAINKNSFERHNVKPRTIKIYTVHR